MADEFIRISRRVPQRELEHQVRDAAAKRGGVFVLAEPWGSRRVRRLAAGLRRHPVPGCHVSVWGRPDGGALLAVTPEQLQSDPGLN